MKATTNIDTLAVDNQSSFQYLGPIFLLLALLLAGAIVYILTNRVVSETTLFDTDEASHAIPVLELYVAAQRHDLAHFWRAVFQQSFYPPVHSLTVLPSYLIAGPSMVTSRIPTVLTFAVFLITVAGYNFLTTAQIPGAGSGIAFVATAATVYFVATSPVLIENAILCMLELLGCLLILLFLWTCRRIDNFHSSRWPRAGAIAIVLLVITLTKYSFGLVTIPATVAAILTGPKPHTGKRSQLNEAKDVLILLAVGLGFWFVIAGVQGAIRFALDQPRYAGLLSAENLFFYPLAWLNEFHLHPVFGFSTVLLAGWGAIKGWDRFDVRTAFWITGFSLLTFTISLNNQPRHFTFASPCIWYLAALGFTHTMVMTVKSARSLWILSASLILIFAFLGLLAFQRADQLQPLLTYSFEGRYGDRNKDMQSYILDNIDLEEKVLILGLFDQLNAVAIRWQGAITTGRAPSEISLITDPRTDLLYSGRLASDDTGGDDYAAVVLQAAVTRGDYSQIVVVYNENLTNSYVAAALDALRDIKSKSREFNDYRIDIFETGDLR